MARISAYPTHQRPVSSENVAMAIGRKALRLTRVTRRRHDSVLGLVRGSGARPVRGSIVEANERTLGDGETGYGERS
jgi:hypothetical protein